MKKKKNLKMLPKLYSLINLTKNPLLLLNIYSSKKYVMGKFLKPPKLSHNC